MMRRLRSFWRLLRWAWNYAPFAEDGEVGWFEGYAGTAKSTGRVDGLLASVSGSGDRMVVRVGPNNTVSFRLSEEGARILWAQQGWKDPKAGPQPGDLYTASLWVYAADFGPYLHVGQRSVNRTPIEIEVFPNGGEREPCGGC